MGKIPDWVKKREDAEAALSAVILPTKEARMSGIYLWERTDENGITWFYVGQAKNIYERQVGHYNGFDRLDKSLHKRGFKSLQNPHGWTFQILRTCEESLLNDYETYYIVYYMRQGKQAYNKTYGSQGAGKEIIYTKEQKGYRQGLQRGYENARRDVRRLFAKYLRFDIEGDPNKNKLKAYEKFKSFLEDSNEENKSNVTT